MPAQPQVTRPEAKSIFRMLLHIDRTNYLDAENYEKWEKEIANPALEALGYTVKRWWTVDITPRKRVAARGVEIEKEGVSTHLYCYAHGQ